MKESEIVKCTYCGGAGTLKHKDMHHPVWKEMVHIDMYKCSACSSLTTYPMPTEEHLSFCYGKYSFDGFPDHKSKAKKSSSQHVWYDEILRIFNFHPAPGVRIADVGAGEGLLEEAMIKRTPDARIDCFDYHDMPQRIKTLNDNGATIGWTRIDLSAPGWMPAQKYDHVFCNSVIEHVINPPKLLNDLLSMTSPGGKVYIIGPCMDTIFYTLLKEKWVYMIPGEHLSMPSLKGIELMMKGINHQAHKARIINVSYSLKYIVDSVFRISAPSFLDIVFRLPTGAFALEITK